MIHDVVRQQEKTIWESIENTAGRGYLHRISQHEPPPIGSSTPPIICVGISAEAPASRRRGTRRISTRPPLQPHMAAQSFTRHPPHPTASSKPGSDTPERTRRKDLRPLNTSNLERYYARRSGSSRRPATMYSKPSTTTSKTDVKQDPIWEDLDW